MRSLKLYFSISPAYIGPLLALADAWSSERKLSKDDADRLRMAAEEFAAYLASVFSGEDASVEFGEYGRRVFVEFSFKKSDIDLSALNMVNIYGKTGNEVSADTSLMLARLSADNFTVEAGPGEIFAIRAYIEKSYPCELPQQPCGAPAPPFTLSENKDTLRAAVLMAAAADKVFASSLYARSPEALMADLDAGAVKAIWAADGAGRPAAFVYWEEKGRTVLFFGPYAASGGPADEAQLFVLEKFISAAAKSGMICLLSDAALPHAAESYFEKRGGLYYRAMNEDCGGAVWAPPAMIPEIDKLYEAFDLIRRIIPADFAPEAGKSLIDVSFSIDRQNASMRPLMIRSDFSELLRVHRDYLADMGCDRIEIVFRLGARAEAAAAAAAYECGFVPKWICPGECRDDTLVMQYAK